MLQKERQYEFRKRMFHIHKENVRDVSLKSQENEFEIEDGMTIWLADYLGDVTLTATRDFAEYLFTSMGVSVMMKKGRPRGAGGTVFLGLAQEEHIELGEYSGYRGYGIETREGICIYGNDERGIAQALYYLEFLMNLRKAPYIKKGIIHRKPRFSPMMVHSGYALDEFPDEHLSLIAHEGRDAILVFVQEANLTTGRGYMDFNMLVYRAALYGIDVYAYSDMKSKIHPLDPGAEAYYEGTYGELFRNCPGFRGVVLVGESVHFPSRDPHAAPSAVGPDGIPYIKESSYYYPCLDYADLVRVIRDACRKYNPDADIIFWTYNFGGMPAEDRVRLIDALPTDISLQATFEMWEQYPMKGITQFVADYTLAIPGPGYYFRTEAEAAKRRGIKLYAMTNTAGLTWDLGTIPYQPAPYQWMKRYQKMLEAQDDWGLCGIMESHHYGIYPSFISKLSNFCFTKSSETMEENLKKVLCAEFGTEHLETVDEALRCWSEAAAHYTPTGEDQYGAFRVGPSYPFCLERMIRLPANPHAMFGSRICIPVYCEEFKGRATLISERVWKEIQSLEEMKELLEQGLALLDTLEHKNDNLLYLENLVHYMCHYVQTGINAKKWHTLKCQFDCLPQREESARILDEMEQLLLAEKENARGAIPYVERDSRLGWEPSMEYLCDREHIEWKLREVDYVLQYEIVNYRKSLQL